MTMKNEASAVMTRNPVTIHMSENVTEAYLLMTKKRIRHLPVVDEGGTIIGILSDRDVQRCVRYDRHNRSPELDLESSLDPKILVADAMSWPAHQVEGDTPLREVALLMMKEKISSVVVRSSAAGKYGILTTDDLLRVLASLLEKEPSRVRMAVDGLLTELYPITEALNTGGI
jgi:acetoin utilization protein AcuB